MFEKLITYLQFPFVRYAFIVGILIAICSALLGVILVLKRYSFIGDGLSHVAFGAISVATVMNLTDNMLFVMPATVLAAVFLLKGGKSRKVHGDAAIAMVSVSALAIGYLLMNVFSASSNLTGDICSTLFGSTALITLSMKDVIVCLVAAVITVAVFIIFYNRIFAVTFDEDFSKASGVRAERYNLLIAVIIAVIIVIAMNLIGSLLISALVVFPALSAMCIFRNFRAVTVCAVIFSVVCVLLGLILSIIFSTPTGATIVTCDLAGYLLFLLCGKIRTCG